MRGFWEDDSNGPALFQSLILSIKPDKATRIAKPKIHRQHPQQNQETKLQTKAGRNKHLVTLRPALCEHVREDVWEGTRASEVGAQKSSASQAMAGAQWTAWGPV